MNKEFSDDFVLTAVKVQAKGDVEGMLIMQLLSAANNAAESLNKTLFKVQTVKSEHKPINTPIKVFTHSRIKVILFSYP